MYGTTYRHGISISRCEASCTFSTALLQTQRSFYTASKQTQTSGVSKSIVTQHPTILKSTIRPNVGGFRRASQANTFEQYARYASRRTRIAAPVKPPIRLAKDSDRKLKEPFMGGTLEQYQKSLGRSHAQNDEPVSTPGSLPGAATLERKIAAPQFTKREEIEEPQLTDEQGHILEKRQIRMEGGRAYVGFIIVLNTIVFMCFVAPTILKPFVNLEEYAKSIPGGARMSDKQLCRVWLRTNFTLSMNGIWNGKTYRDTEGNVHVNWKQWILPNFAHENLMHFGFNMMAFYSVTGALVRIYSWRTLGAIYLVGGAVGAYVGALITQLTNPVAGMSQAEIHRRYRDLKKESRRHKMEATMPKDLKKEIHQFEAYAGPSLGASVAITTTLAITAFAAPWARYQLMFIPVEFSAKQLMVGLMAFDTVGVFVDLGLNLGHAAHLGGYVTGLAMWLLWLRRRRIPRLRSL